MSEDRLLEDPTAIYTAMWVTCGVLLLWLGRRMFGALPGHGIEGTIVVTPLFVTGIGLILAASLERVDLRRWSLPVAGWVLYLVASVSFFHYTLMPATFFASDVSLFESWGAHLLLQGENPMAANMVEARGTWNASANLTQTTTGGHVSSYSYPGGSLWLAALEVAVLGVRRVGVTNVLVATALGAWLVRHVDRDLVPLALLAMIAPVSFQLSAALGMITPFWVAPLAVGIAAWYRGRLDVAAVGFGVAVAVKQLAWPIVGLAMIHVLRVHGRRRAAVVATITAGVAGLLVLPFVIWNPTAWVISALFPFLPVGDPLVAQGVGLTSATVSGWFAVPRDLHRILVIGSGVGLLAATWYRPRAMQYVIPFSMILVLMLHYRTLPSYYSATVPLAIVVVQHKLAGSGQVRTHWPIFDRAIERLAHAVPAPSSAEWPP